MDRWKRGKKFAYHVLFAGLTCVCIAATGFLLTARSQTIEIYRGGEIEEMTFENGVPVSKFRSRARVIMAEAVTAAEEGDYELALRIAKAALDFEADWGPDEVTPQQLIEYIESGQHLEDEVQVAATDTSGNDWQEFNSETKPVTSDELEEYRPPLYQPQTTEVADTTEANPVVAEPQPFPEFDPSANTAETATLTDSPPGNTAPTAPKVKSNQPVKLPDSSFEWQPTDVAMSGIPLPDDQIETASGQMVSSPPRGYSQARVAANGVPFNTGLQRFEADNTTRPNSFPPVGDTRNPQATATDLNKQLPQGVHFNVSTAPPQTAGVSNSEPNTAFYITLAVLSLIFVFGATLVFLAVFLLLKDKQSQQQGVIRLELGSLSGLGDLARLLQLTGGQPVAASQPAEADSPAAVAESTDEPPTLQIAGQPDESPEDAEDAMFQHLLEDNIELYRNLNQLPKAA